MNTSHMEEEKMQERKAKSFKMRKLMKPVMSKLMMKERRQTMKKISSMRTTMRTQSMIAETLNQLTRVRMKNQSMTLEKKTQLKMQEMKRLMILQSNLPSTTPACTLSISSNVLTRLITLKLIQMISIALA